jgi:hypothetical protein
MQKPLSPYLALAIGILLPRTGHVPSGARHGTLTLKFFMIALALVTWHLVAPETDSPVRHSGELFVYATSSPLSL